MLINRQKVKNYFQDYPRTTKVLGFIYHTVNFYRINKQRIKMYEEQLQLHRYFEKVYGEELDYLRDHGRELEQILDSSGINFERRFPTSGMLPTCSPRSEPYKEEAFLKYYETKNRWAGMTAGQRLYLESWCLKRLNTASEKDGGTPHFPILYKVDSELNSIEMSHCGSSIYQVNKDDTNIIVDRHAEQVDNIVRLLEEAGVYHLDLRPDGKNLCVSPEGHLTLIDFDSAVLEGEVPMSAQVIASYEKACKHPRGYRGWALEKLHVILESHRDRLILR